MRLDWRGLLIAMAFIALLCADFFLSGGCQIMCIARWGIPLALLAVGAIILGLTAVRFMK